jgi:hypothetical protein
MKVILNVPDEGVKLFMHIQMHQVVDTPLTFMFTAK